MRWHGLMGAACMASLVWGCGLISPFDRSKIKDEASGGTGGGTGGGGSAGDGGTSGGAPCSDAELDCPAPPSGCTVALCAAGQCTTAKLPDGSAAGDVKGDCAASLCQGGDLVSESDDSDVPTDLGDCIIEACKGGSPASDPAAAGAACDENAGKVCDGAGKCVGCNKDTDCTAPDICDLQSHSCTVSSCQNMMKNGDESDVDCGGSSCPQCPDGAACNGDGDCKGGKCQGQKCTDDCVCAGCTAGVPCNDCPGSGDVTYKDPDTGRCYAYVDDPADWDSARTKCQSWMAGADLAAPSTAAEMIEVTVPQIVEVFKGGDENTRCWIGGNDRVTEGQYAWSNGEAWKNAAAGGPPWGPGEPTGEGGANDEDCIVIGLSPQKATIMRDRKCPDKFAYLCERP